MRRPTLSLRALVAPLAVAFTMLPGAPPVAASSTGYSPPVDAPVIDEFRPPPDRFSAGNRGIDYAVAPGAPVHAAADGVVTFAGQVGGAIHAVVLHEGGIRTSYSYLASAAVWRGQRIRQGDVVGTAGVDPLHFGARVGEEYFDPLSLFTPSRPRVRLLPDDGKGLPPEASERSALDRLVRTLGRIGRAPAALVAWAGSGLPSLLGAVPGDLLALAASLRDLLPDPDLAELVAAVMSTAGKTHPWLAMAAAAGTHVLSRGPCTPRSTPVPAPPRERRLAVLVAGLGSSSSGNPSIRGLDTAALGYEQGDVFEFSYRGGSTAHSPYTALDTQGDPAAAGRRLRMLLDDLAVRHRGVPIDVFAHSLGGLVARAALVEPGANPPPVQHLVTFGTPHNGADLATVVDAAPRSPLGMALTRAAAAVRPMGLDPTKPVVDALAPGSAFVRSLARTPLPATVKATSIAARTDLVVPAPRSWLKGATNVVVPGRSVNAHRTLPESPAAQREAALALAGRPPTCEPLLDAALDAATATAVQVAEAALALSAPRRSGASGRSTWEPPVG